MRGFGVQLLAAVAVGAGLVQCGDPTSAAVGTFRAANSAPSSLVSAAALLADGRVLVAGTDGDESAAVSSTAELFDTGTGAFLAAGSLGEDFFAYTATPLVDGRVLVVDGRTGRALAFHPDTGAFTPAGQASSEVGVHAAVILPDGRVFIVPTESSSAPDVQLFDPGAQRFLLAGRLATERTRFSATVLADGRVLIAGGYSSTDYLAGGAGYLTSAEVFDPRTGSSVPTGPMATARDRHSATLLDDGRVLIVGGETRVGGWTENPIGDVATAELYDPSTGTFSRAGTMTDGGRSMHTATRLADGRVLIVGGKLPHAAGEVFDPLAGRFNPTASLTTELTEVTSATLLLDGRVLVTGQSFRNNVRVSNAELFLSATTQ